MISAVLAMNSRISMGARSAPASGRGHSFLGLAAPALCIAGLLLVPGRACGQFQLFDFGAGIDYLSELQKSLTISSSSGTVTVRDLEGGTTETVPLDGDPRLLNRKFDIEWSMNGPGVLIPISGSVGTGWGRVQTSFSLQAREGDFDLRFLNQREEGADDSLHGRGTFYGAELAVTALCRSCPWFAESGYRFQKLSGADADRSQSFNSPGLRVMGDENRLSRETRDAFARFGYSFTGKDIVTYTGVRHRWADVEVEDELRLFDPQFNQETTLRSKTKLDSRATEAIIGLEARRGSFIGRTEIAFNEEDYGASVQIIYSRPAKEDHNHQEFRKRMARIAVEITPDLRRITNEFLRDREKLRVVEGNGGSMAYLQSDLAALLDGTEHKLSEVLQRYPELDALNDWAQDQFIQLRQDLKRGNSPTGGTHLARFSQSWALLQTGSTKPEPQYGILGAFATSCLAFITNMSEKDELSMDLTFNTKLGPETQLEIYPKYHPKKDPILINIGDPYPIPRGTYSYQVYERTHPQSPIRCCDSAGNSKQRGWNCRYPSAPCPLDLVKKPWRVFHCDNSGCSQQQ
jgi:hypothetical protein